MIWSGKFTQTPIYRNPDLTGKPLAFSPDHPCKSNCFIHIPLMPLSGLLPALLFPFFGIMDTKEVCGKYFNYVSMLMLATLLIAESFERCGLHRRLALKILSVLGRGEALLMLGAMICTWLLSMFMSNTATTAMMLPIADAIIDSLREVTARQDIQLSKVGSPDQDDQEVSGQFSREQEQEFKRFTKGLLLCVPYGASIGGIATLTDWVSANRRVALLNTKQYCLFRYPTGHLAVQGLQQPLLPTNFNSGTPPNLVLQTIFEASFPSQPSIDYKTWLFMAFPLSAILLIVGWTVLCLVYARTSWINLITLKLCCDRSGSLNDILRTIYPLGENKEREKWNHINRTIQVEYKTLGSMRFTEIVLTLIVLLLVFLWLFMLPDQFPGWAQVRYKYQMASQL
eukprot:sb/3465404/